MVRISIYLTLDCADVGLIIIIFLGTLYCYRFKTYTLTKYWCYRITSLLLAVPLAIIWGVNFSCLTFWRVWCCVPCLRSCDIELHCVRRLCELCLRTYLAPICEAAGRLCYHIRIRVIKGDDTNN